MRIDPLPMAFNLFDNTAEWPELALAIGLAFLGAYIITLSIGRLVRWSVRGVLQHEAARRHWNVDRSSVEQPLLVARLGIFFVTWVALSLPLLDAIGLPLELGESRVAMRRFVFASGVRIAIILAVSSLVLRIARSTVERLERELAGASTDIDVIERTRRAQTLGRLIQNVLAVIVTSIAGLMILRELGVDILPMLTGAGIVGVALGFGSQYLVRDVIAGFFVILENQVRVGDVAAINGVGGVVESVNLRTITLRDGEGTVHVFQHGNITTLANRSKDYAYYVIDVNVLYNQDPDAVVALLKQVGEELAADPAYKDRILEPLEVLGVDAFLDTKITIKVRIKTPPLKQWDVGRELRRRIVIAFERNEIALQPLAVPLYVRPERITNTD